MTTPPQQPPQPAPPEYLAEKHRDRRVAAEQASAQNDGFTSWEQRADAIYAWLRAPFEPDHLVITPGVPQDRAPSPSEGAAS